MKTADLIPFILLELNERDKYGFELTKAIENKSNGQIIIKQPTLYTLLKKLEKSKFITSYWEDSEIGGKRHYYKLTQNGKLQVSTLPSYEFLMKNALSEDEHNETVEEIISNEETDVLEEKKVSIIDELLNSSPAPAESILPTKEVFTEENIDSSTELEINIANTEILKQPQITTDEQFATNENVSKFTEKVTSTPTINEDLNKSNNSFLDIEYTIPKNDIDVSYVDYVDFKNTDAYIKSKSITKKMLLQSLSTSLSLFVLTILCSIITSFTGKSGLFYFFFISSIIITLFYPIILATNLDRLKQKYQNKEYKCKTKLKLYVGILLILAVLVLCGVVSISVGKNTIQSILSIKNFANLYAPILLTSAYFLDILYNHVFCSKIK